MAGEGFLPDRTIGMPRILVIEDDPTVASAIERQLRGKGHDVVRTADGQMGLEHATREYFDAITLDRLLPSLDGLTLVSRLRERSISVPVLMISALSDVDERIAGLRAGGDDYMIKPFSAQEMVARIDVLLRRTASAVGDAILRTGYIEMNLLKRTVSFAGKPLKLPHMEFRLLEFLVRNAGKTVSRRFIFEQVWGYYFDPGANLINVHIGRLRRKLDLPGQPAAISTIKGEGYRLEIV
jgi:two-component system OmpR family response regulator